MSNIIIWAHQSTVDYNFQVSDQINEVMRMLLGDSRRRLPKHEKDFEEILNLGLHEDRTIDVSDDGAPEEIINDLDEIKKYLGNNFPHVVQIGGNPAISAIRGHWLSQGSPNALPSSIYVGLFPRSVENALQDFPNELRKVFHKKKRIDEMPQSIGIETDTGFKLILIYGKGRLIENLDPNADFSSFCNDIKDVFALLDQKSRAIFAFTMPPLLREMILFNWVSIPGVDEDKLLRHLRDNFNIAWAENAKIDKSDDGNVIHIQGDKNEATIKIDWENENATLKILDGKTHNLKVKREMGKINIYRELEKEEQEREIDYTKKLIGQLKETMNREIMDNRLLFFVSTRNIKDIEYANITYEFLNDIKSDIISMNETEADWIHTALNKGHTDEPLAYKVRDLPFKAIKVCHSAAGVIMDLGCIPEKIVNSEVFPKDPAKYLEEVLRLSADGATYALDATAERLSEGGKSAATSLGRMANESMIRIYSQNIKQEFRQNERFKATFFNLTQQPPAGMIGIAAANVVRPRGALVGLGAIFDSLLLSFLMRT